MCIYDVAERIMLRRFQVRSVDVHIPGNKCGCAGSRYNVWIHGVLGCLQEGCGTLAQLVPKQPRPPPISRAPTPFSSSPALLVLQVTSNRSLDGVLDTLNSRNMTDAGPLQLIDHEDKVCEGDGKGGA